MYLNGAHKQICKETFYFFLVEKHDGQYVKGPLISDIVAYSKKKWRCVKKVLNIVYLHTLQKFNLQS